EAQRRPAGRRRRPGVAHARPGRRQAVMPAARWRLRRWAVTLIVVEAIMLGVAITLGAVGLKQLGDARALVVDQIDPELLQAQNLTAALLNQETGVRGYQLTREGSFLTPYTDGRQLQDQAVAELRRLGATAGTPAGTDLDAVLSTAGAWQRTVGQLIAGSTDPGVLDRSKIQFDNLRFVLDKQQANLGVARDD